MTTREQLSEAIAALPDDRLDDVLQFIKGMSEPRVGVIGGFNAEQLKAKGLPVKVGQDRGRGK